MKSFLDRRKKVDLINPLRQLLDGWNNFVRKMLGHNFVYKIFSYQKLKVNQYSRSGPKKKKIHPASFFTLSSNLF